jgi:hypothetical protein
MHSEDDIGEDVHGKNEDNKPFYIMVFSYCACPVGNSLQLPKNNNATGLETWLKW